MESRWHGYLQSLPRCVDIAVFWGSETDNTSERLNHPLSEAHRSDDWYEKVQHDHKEARVWLKGTQLQRQIEAMGCDGVSLQVGLSIPVLVASLTFFEFSRNQSAATMQLLWNHCSLSIGFPVLTRDFMEHIPL